MMVTGDISTHDIGNILNLAITETIQSKDHEIRNRCQLQDQ
jgi:hypothetical protein